MDIYVDYHVFEMGIEVEDSFEDEVDILKENSVPKENVFVKVNNSKILEVKNKKV